MSRIGVDLDGVVFDLHTRLKESYRNWFGLPSYGFVEWDEVLSLSRFDTWPKLWEWADRAGVFDDLDYIVGAPGAIDDMLAEGLSPIFVTARTGAAAQKAVDWHKSSPWAKTTEIRTAQTNKLSTPCSIYVDDSPQVIEQVLAAKKKAIVFDQPWNQKVDAPRAESWSEVLELIGELL